MKKLKITLWSKELNKMTKDTEHLVNVLISINMFVYLLSNFISFISKPPQSTNQKKKISGCQTKVNETHQVLFCDPPCSLWRMNAWKIWKIIRNVFRRIYIHRFWATNFVGEKLKKWTPSYGFLWYFSEEPLWRCPWILLS